MAELTGARQQWVERQHTSQPAHSLSSERGEPVTVFHSVVAAVSREVAAVDAAATALLAAHTAQSAAPVSPQTSDSHAAALSVFRDRVAAVCARRPAALESQQPPAESEAAAASMAAVVCFPSIERAFALLARRLQRPFTPLYAHYAATDAPPRATAAATSTRLHRAATADQAGDGPVVITRGDPQQVDTTDPEVCGRPLTALELSISSRAVGRPQQRRVEANNERVATAARWDRRVKVGPRQRSRIAPACTPLPSLS